ncbi:hypothetical protein G4B88_028267 [Cannabis sativa]|uniref:Uncharacterized protein n=1 Tax=Cannabis sativa TaxID=3483 RepID=A0A7J6GD88_CANSA|nr:hypothetical protein G4B88_028267 [Cannabis sativa]
MTTEPSSRSRNNDIVDANLSILGARIEEIKVKEKLERCCSSSDKYYGWNNNNNYYEVGSNGNGNYRKRSGHEAPLKQLLELATIVGGTLGFTFFTASLFLCLVSLFVHINQLASLESKRRHCSERSSTATHSILDCVLILRCSKLR